MSILGSINPLRSALDYHLGRHNILTSNLANVDTPGYRAQDLKRASPFDNVLHTQMKVTEAGHIGHTTRPAGKIQSRSLSRADVEEEEINKSS